MLGFQPLAARMRPTTLDEVVGQKHLVGENGSLRALVANKKVPSMILWGPPGTGKTTLATIIAKSIDAYMVELSATSAGVKEIRQILEQAGDRHSLFAKETIVFIDEIHRFNKRQQDALLPSVEAGDITLIGATTENPSFEVNAALLSRTILYRTEPIGNEDIGVLIDKALESNNGSVKTITEDARQSLIYKADGDARVALTGLETAINMGKEPIDVEVVKQALASPHLRYDKDGDHHYDQISAFIKSIRGSDVHASMYWLTRILAGGEDPKFLARRMVILASEDIGLADPQALLQANAAFDAVNTIGLPEARYALSQACIYLALAPKSNSITRAMTSADREVERLGNAPVPTHLRDAHYKGAEKLGHGDGYMYPHNYEGNWIPQQYGPKGLGTIYIPGDEGAETEITKWRLERKQNHS